MEIHVEEKPLITSAVYGKRPITEENCCINATINGVKWSVSLDPENSQYQQILEWVSEGNTIHPGTPEEPA